MENFVKDKGPLFAFNIWDISSAKAVLDAASEMKKNVILQTSAGIFKDAPKKQLREFVSSYSNEKGIQAWLHLDHCRDKGLIGEAIQFGWDSVMIDMSAKELTENIRITNEITALAHAKDVLVEAEVGQVKGIEEDISSENSILSSKAEIDRFMKETDIDMIAVAFGNAHGMYQGTPQLEYDLVEYTVGKYDVPFVVHGGSGLDSETIKKLLSISGVKKINISTEVKLAYRDGILLAKEQGLFEQSGFQANKVETMIQNSIVELVKSKLMLLE